MTVGMNRKEMRGGRQLRKEEGEMIIEVDEEENYEAGDKIHGYTDLEWEESRKEWRNARGGTPCMSHEQENTGEVSQII